jgi:hypothetical protein
VNIIPANELLSNYGAKSQNTQYITEEEQEKYNLTQLYTVTYNNNLPHYQYAYSLFTNNITDFFQTPSIGVEKSHDYMHDLNRLIMADSSFSVNSLIFWPYHGWIDAIIEIYLRRQNLKGGPDSPFVTMSKTLSNNKNALPKSLQPTLGAA